MSSDQLVQDHFRLLDLLHPSADGQQSLAVLAQKPCYSFGVLLLDDVISSLHHGSPFDENLPSPIASEPGRRTPAQPPTESGIPSCWLAS